MGNKGDFVGFFDRFSRKSRSVLPEEANDYYQTQRRERAGVAIMLALIALIVTLVVAAGLFYGGRYVYREFIKDDNTGTVQTEDENSSVSESEVDTIIDGQVVEGETNDDAADSPASGGTETSQEESADSTESENTDSTPDTGDDQTTPNTGDEQPTLPHTGDPL